MKGVSAVIAVVLILMITVALAAMAYVWFTTVFTQITTGAGAATEQQAKALGTQFTIESAKNLTDATSLNVTIRNSGTQDINLDKMAVYLDDGLQSGNIIGLGGMLAPGSVKSFQITGVQPCSRVLKLTTEVGTSQSASTRCS